MVTFVDQRKVRSKKDPGFCYLKAGFKKVGKTKGLGLVALQLLPEEMPRAEPAIGMGAALFKEEEMDQLRLGERGGSTESLAEGQALFNDYKPDEQERLRRYIIRVGARNGEIHADDFAHIQLSHSNMIGATINALATERLLEKRNREGEVEHRRARARASHGRRSYVWRLTPKGQRYASMLDAGSV